MTHLLLHAGGTSIGCGLRILHLHDIAKLAERMSDADWDEVLAHGASQGRGDGVARRRGFVWASTAHADRTLFFIDPAARISGNGSGLPVDLAASLPHSNHLGCVVVACADQCVSRHRVVEDLA